MAAPKDDVRTPKLGRALRAAGHDVYIGYQPMRRRGWTTRIFHVLRNVGIALSSRDFDVQHLIDPWDIGLLPYLFNGVPTVFDMRSNWSYMIRTNRKGLKSQVLAWLARQVTKFMVRHADHTVTVDPRLAQMLLQMKPRRWSYLKNLPEEAMFKGAKFHQRRPGYHFGYAGVIGPERRTLELLRAWKWFADRQLLAKLDYHLHIVGWCNDPAYWRQVEPLIGYSKPYVHFYGRIPLHRMAQFYRQMDCLIIPNRGDHWSLKLWEAVAAKVPLILCDGKLHRMVMGDAAEYFASGDIDELDIVHAIERAVRRMNLLTSAARKLVAPTWEENVQQLIGIYAQLVKDERPKSDL